MRWLDLIDDFVAAGRRRTCPALLGRTWLARDEAAWFVDLTLQNLLEVVADRRLYCASGTRCVRTAVLVRRPAHARPAGQGAGYGRSDQRRSRDRGSGHRLVH